MEPIRREARRPARWAWGFAGRNGDSTRLDRRGEWKADYRDYSAPIKVFSHDALIRVESIRIEKL